jgi:hypothetical protein
LPAGKCGAIIDAMNRTALALALACPMLLGSYCSLSAGIGPDDDPPSVSLAAAPQEAAPGQVIGLVAAADDDYSVVEVRFYRVDAGGDTLLGIDGSAPYALETVLPAGVGASVRYFAQAVDDAGQRAVSAEVTVAVR